MAIISSGSMHQRKKNANCAGRTKRQPLGLVNQILYRKPGVHFNGCVGGYKRYRLFYRRQNNNFNTEDINEDDNPKIIGRLNRKTGVQDSNLRTAYRSALTLADLMHDKLLRGLLLLSIMYYLTRPPVRRPPCSFV
jgi:hypothetical protein